MKWVNDERVFKDVASTARHCIDIDDHSEKSSFSCLIFDSSELCTRAFFRLLQDLMKLGGDANCYYLVVDPDPRSYFQAHFHKFPLIEINQDDDINDYISILNEDPGGSPADAIGTNWSEYLIFPPSKGWFVRSRRDDEGSRGGHLCVPAGWASQVTRLYLYIQP